MTKIDSLVYFLYCDTHIDLCAIEYSLGLSYLIQGLGDAPTALKHGDESCLHIGIIYTFLISILAFTIL